MRHNSKERDKKLADNVRLLRWWRAFHREQRDAVLAGPHATTLGELFRMFSNIKHVTPAQLVGFIGAIDWSGIDVHTRLVVLHELNFAIVKHREQQGLPPLSDPLPGQPDNAFRIIKNLLEVSREAGRPMHRGPYPGADHK
jgi:hypothetical protein